MLCIISIISIILLIYAVGVIVDYNSHCTCYPYNGNLNPLKRQATKKEAWAAVLWPWRWFNQFLKAVITIVKDIKKFLSVLFEKDSN